MREGEEREGEEREGERPDRGETEVREGEEREGGLPVLQQLGGLVGGLTQQLSPADQAQQQRTAKLKVETDTLTPLVTTWQMVGRWWGVDSSKT